MASDFLTSLAKSKAQKIDQQFGPNAYGGTKFLTSSTPAGAQAPASPSRDWSFFEQERGSSSARSESGMASPMIGSIRFPSINKTASGNIRTSTLDRYAEKAAYDDNIQGLKSRLATLQEEKSRLEAGLALDMVAPVQNEIEQIQRILRYDGKEYDDNFFGQFGASYAQGRLSQDEAYGWNAYLGNPTPDAKQYAENISSALREFQIRNKDALDEDAVLPAISQDLAGYLPQFVDQTKARVAGGAAGAAAGALIPVVGIPNGIRAGAIAGSSMDMYNLTRGYAFKALVDEGVDVDTARSLAGDEAFLSSILEAGDTMMDMATLGVNGIIKNAAKGSLKGFAKKGAEAAASVAGNKLKQILEKHGVRLIGGYLANVAGEAAQEGAQQVVSIANRDRGVSGDGSGIPDLFFRSIGTGADILTGKNPDGLDEVADAAAQGAKIAAMMGGATILGTQAVNRALGTIASSPEAVEDAVQTPDPEPAASANLEQTQADAREAAILRILEENGVTGTPANRQAQGVAALIDGGELSSHRADEIRKSRAAQAAYTQITGETIDTTGRPAEVRARIKQMALDKAAERNAQNVVETIPTQAAVETATQEATEAPVTPVTTMGTVDTNQAETSPVIQYTPSPASDLDTISQRVSNIKLVDRMAQESQVLGEAGRAAAMTRYDGTTDPSGYYAGFMQAYNDGMNGKRNRQNSVLTKEQYNQAYNAGRTDSRAGLTREGAGLVRNAAAAQLQDAGTIDALAKKLGVTVVAEDSISSPNGRQSGANGYMKGREIHISLKSEDPAMVVFKHEVTHYLQEQNAKGYQAFRDYAVQAMGEDEVRRVQDLYRRGGVELTWDGAMDEVAANYTEKLLTDEEAVRRLIRDDRNLAQKILDAIKGLLQKVKGQEGTKLRQAEKLWTEMFREIAGQEQADRGTMEVRYSKKGEPLYGREETEQTAKGSVRKNDTGRKDGGRENSAGTGGEGILSSVRMLSRGEKPYHSWAEEGLIVPEPGSVAESEARVVRGEYQLPVFVVKSDIFNRNHPKAPAFARGGQVFLREDLPEIGRGDIGAHEAGHAMKEIGYLPYLDFIEKTPELINRSHPLAGKILEHASKHTEVDLFNMSDQDAIDLYDEINNMVYGAIHAGRTEAIDIIRPVFFDFDAYSKELSSIHEQFKKERNNGARFSMKSPVEQTYTLIALHNLTESNLLSAIRLGGFPMPSIAVTRTDIPHTNFGEISLVMDKRAVDPKASRKNTVYSADAWTPTFPQVEYAADAAAERRISGRLNSLSRQIDEMFRQDLYRVSYDMEDLLNRYGGEVGLVEHAMDNYGLKAAYLEDHGHHVSAVTTQREVDKGYNPDRADKYQAVADALGTTDPQEIGQMPLKQVREKYGDALEQAFPGMTKSALRMGSILRQVQAYFENQGGEPAYETVTDSAATRRAVDSAIDADGYARWVRELFSGIAGDSGIYNNKERFSPSGNRRTFQQTHYPVTLDNIVKAMKGQNGGNRKNVSGFYGVKSLRAGTARRFKNIADMHSLESRLQNLTEEETKAINDALDERLIDITGELAEKSPGGAREYDYYQADTIGNIMVEIADGGTYTIDSITGKFNGEYGYHISNELAAKVRDLLFDVSQMPVNLFEAKPERAVGFDEVLAAVVPDDSSKDLTDALSQAGVRTLEYKSGDDADRIAKINSVEGARFSLKSTDNKGRKLTEEQLEYFRDSIIRDDKGHLMVMYHGTRNGGFTVFGGGKDYFYFTNDKRYAYIFEGRKANGQFYPSTRSDIEAGLISPQRYEVYLNVTNPFIAEQDIVEDSLYWDRSLAQKLREKGYDALMMEDMSQVIVLSPEQIKDVTNKYPTNDPDIRFSLRQENQRLDDVAARLDQIRQEGEKAGKSEAEILTEIRGEVDSTLERLRTQYGTIPEGERPTREANAPKQTTEQERVSQTVRTVLEAGVTPDAMVPTIQEAIARGDFSYESFTDKMAIDRAAEKITDENYQDTKETWLADVASGKVSKESTALGWALYNNAANSGHVEDAMKILTAMIEHQRSAAQAVQATRILKRSSPTAQLYGVKRSVENLQKELKERYGDKAPDLEINRDLAEQFLQAKTPEAQTEALRQLYMDIGRQMPSRFIDKWNAWRYLAMLGNPRTHIRNVLGNAFFAPVVGVKNLTATAIEAAVDRAVYKGTMNRSKGLLTGSKADRALLKAAWEDFSNVYDEIQGVGKYNDAAQANRYIQDGKVVFRSKLLHFLEVMRKKNGDLLELEDMWFSQPHYAAALAGYMKANGLTVQQLKNGRGIAEARAYAVLEAQKATYRDMNQFSEFVSGIGKYRGKNSAKKAASLAAEGILPFRQTPANILVRGVEYSPIGLLKSLTVDLNRVRKGEMEAYEAIDHISAGLTGTGLMGLGILLASLSLVRGAGGDDKEKREFEELMGHQAYALELPDGTSVTLDWLAPEALPFFVGVNLWEQSAAQNEKATMSTLLQAVSSITDPMLEMSVLQSLNDLINSVGYASSNGLDGVMSILASAATSYLTQGIPTLFGQIERTAQDKRMTTYTEQDAFLTGDMQYTLGTSSGRIPGWDYQQIPYIDAWGRTEDTGSVGQRGVNNFLNPAYTSTIQESGMERELLRLYEATGDGSLLPSRAPKKFTVNNEQKNLTAEEYVAYATTRGETAHDLLWELAQERAYQSLDDESKAELVKNVYSYADAVGRTTVSDYTPTGLNADLLKLDEGGFDVADYLLLKAAGEAAGLSQLEIAVSSTDQALSSQLILNNYEAQRTAEAFTDPSRSGYEYQMNAGQQAQFTSLYEEAMEQALDKLFAGSRYQAADTEERRDMVSDLQAETNAKVKKEMARTLRAAGVRSVKKG